MFLWKIPNDYPEQLLGKYDREHGPDRFCYKQGSPLDSIPSHSPKFRFNASVAELRELHDLGNNAMVPLVSPAVVQILNNLCPADVQLVPATASCADGEIEDYSIVVVTHRIRGLDHAESVYKCIPGTESIMRLEKAVYIDSCLGTHDTARDEEYLSNLLISNRLYEAFEGCKGIGLYETE